MSEHEKPKLFQMDLLQENQIINLLTQLLARFETLEKAVEYITKRVDRTCLTLHGNGTEDSPGIAKVVDRLNIAESNRNSNRTIVFTAIIGAFFLVILGALASHIVFK